MPTTRQTIELATRQTIKSATRQTKRATHNAAELHWKTASARGIPPSSAVIRRGDGATICRPEGPAAASYASEVSDELEGEEPIPEATY